MPEALIHIQYCYDYLLNQIPIELLLYAHVPAAILAILFGIFLLSKTRSVSGIALFVVFISFAGWCLLSLSTWFSFLGAANTMFTWSLIDLLALIFFFFGYYFLYTFITNKDLPAWQKITGGLLLLPTTIWTFLGSNLTLFDLNVCEAWENESITLYPYFVEGVFLIASIALIVITYKRAKDHIQKKKILFAGLGIAIFLGFFFLATFSVNLLVNYSFVEYAYNFEIYGLFGMPILLGFLTYLMVRYHAFNIKLIGAQALVFALLALTGSQFFFIQGSTARILNIITVALALIFGRFLIRGVKSEIEQKNKLQILSKELEESNEKLKSLDKLKTEFLSLASHQLRSPLTAIKGYASMLDEGTLGELTKEQDTAARRIYASAQGLVNLVEDLLNVSKIEQGGMKYEMMPTDLAKVVSELAGEMRIPAENKKLELKVSIPKDDAFTITADPVKIKQVFLNLVDNSIKYTPSGSVEIGLKREAKKKVVFYVKDTGVGVTAETKAKLFEKFSRGEGGKLNTGGSGLGLYLAGQIAKAHKGTIDVESEGMNKGTTFIVTLPV